MIKTVKLTEVKPNDQNPRYITETMMGKLVKSIREFPEMLEVRPLVVNKEMVTLAGNMRLKALKLAEIEELPVQVVNWSKKKQQEFIIKDNLSYGSWDWQMLADDWQHQALDDWGLDYLPASDVDLDELFDDSDVTDKPPKHELTFKFATDEVLESVKQKFDAMSGSKEENLMKLLGL